MAVKVVFVFILSLFLRVSLSLPVSLDVKTVLSTESGLTERTTVIDSETVIRLEEENKLVQSLSTETLLKAFESFEADHGRRIRRFITKTQVLCPADMIEYAGKCLTKEKLEEDNTETLLKDFESFEEDHGTRIKRQIARLGLCPSDTIRIKQFGRCIPKKKYKQDYDDQEGSSD